VRLRHAPLAHAPDSQPAKRPRARSPSDSVRARVLLGAVFHALVLVCPCARGRAFRAGGSGALGRGYLATACPRSPGDETLGGARAGCFCLGSTSCSHPLPQACSRRRSASRDL
jgi:hypothetical protein